MSQVVLSGESTPISVSTTHRPIVLVSFVRRKQ